MKTLLDNPRKFVSFTAWASKHFPRFTVDYRTNVEARWAFRKAVRNNPTLML